MENQDQVPTLNVGDALYHDTRYYGLQRYTVTRLTKTIAYVMQDGGGSEYKATAVPTEFFRGEFVIQGKGDNKDRYYLETPKLKARYEKEQKQGKIGDFFNRAKWREALSDSDLDAICAVIERSQKK